MEPTPPVAESARPSPAPVDIRSRASLDRVGAGYVATFDGWRALAVLTVIAWHHRMPTADASQGLDYLLSQVAETAVCVFFCLSGYLLCSRLLEQQATTGRIALGAYFVRRVFRILPPLLLFLTFMAILGWAERWQVTQQEWAASTFFYRNYVHGAWQVGHLWTLAVEEHFYLLLPLLLLVPAVRKRLWVLPALCVAVAVWRFLVLSVGIGPPRPPAGTDIRLDNLLNGVWMAILLRDEGRRTRVARWLTPSVWAVSASLTIACLWLPLALRITAMTLTVPILIGGTMLHPEWRGSRWLERPFLRWIGLMSFSMYLFQQVLARDDGLLVAGWVLILPATVLAYYFVEVPSIALGRELVARRWGALRRPRAWPVLAVLAIGATTVALFAVRLGDLDRSVTIFVDGNLTGANLRLGPGIHDLSGAGQPNDVISSLTVGHDVEALVCVDIVGGRGAGACSEFGPGTVVPQLPPGWNDAISFIQVRRARERP